MDNIVKKLALANWWLVGVGVACGLGILAIFWKNLPPEVPLLYGLPWGQEQLVKKIFLWGMPILTGVIGATIGLISTRLESDKVLDGMMLGTSIVMQLVLILALARIIFLII